MSDTNEPIPTCPPSSPNKTVDKGGYRASFYPGFVSRLVMRDPTGLETELYQQEEVFCLPPGYSKPWPASTLEFSRPDGRRIVLQIDDPHQQIGRIEVHLKSADAATTRPELVRRVVGDRDEATLGASLGVGGAGRAEVVGEVGEDGTDLVLIAEDGPVLCPPICPGTT